MRPAWRRSGLWLAVICCAAPAASQQTWSSVPSPDAARVLSLKTGTVPDASGPELWRGPPGDQTARNVAVAGILPVLPDPSGRTGAAVVVAPGGAFLTLGWDAEGTKVARALAARGIAAFVLKYRVEPSPPGDAAFARLLGSRLAGWVGTPGQRLTVATPAYAVVDALAAMRFVRTRAGEYGIDPSRVGIVGFSAGARLALAAALAGTPEDRPAFIGAVYPPMESIPARSDAPPLFIAMAIDDPLSRHAGFGLVESWIAVRRPVELHDYQRGGHGFGLGVGTTTASGWLDGFLRWMKMNGMMETKR